MLYVYHRDYIILQEYTLRTYCTLHVTSRVNYLLTLGDTVKLEALALLNFDSKNFDKRNVGKMLVKALIFLFYIVCLFCLVALL